MHVIGFNIPHVADDGIGGINDHFTIANDVRRIFRSFVCSREERGVIATRLQSLSFAGVARTVYNNVVFAIGQTRNKLVYCPFRYRLARACHRLERAYHKLGVVLYRIRFVAVCIGIGYFYYAIAEAARKGDYAAAFVNALNRSVRLCKRPYRRLIGCARRYVYGGFRERYARLLILNNSLYGLLLLRDFFAVKVYFYAGINRFGACLDNHFLVEIELVTGSGVVI